MAKRQEDTTEEKSQLNRRSYLQLSGLAAAAAATTFTGVMTEAVAASPETVVDLGAQGLSDGDTIDSYLEEYVDDNVEVRIPEGEYDWEGDGFTGANENAAIVGQGEVILNNVTGEYRQTISADAETIEIRNITVRGINTGDESRFRLQAKSGAKIVIDNVNFPDGSEERAGGQGFYVPRRHAGTVEIRNCYISNFGDNAIYASSPGYSDGGDGPVIIENCTTHNNTITGIRIGSSDTVVRNCLVLNDADGPRSPNNNSNQRGIWVRGEGDNITIEDTEIIHSYSDASAPITFNDEARGGSGTISNVRILNNTSQDAIGGDSRASSDWTGNNISITGDGNLDSPSQFNATTGSSAEEPTGEDPQGDTTVEDSEDSDGSDSSGSSGSDDPAEGTDRLLVTTSPSDGATYEFTATGEITPRYDLTQYNANDDSVGEEATENDDGTWTATGALSGGSTSGDSFDVAGDITAFSIDGASDAVSLYLNDSEISVDDLVNSDADQSDDGQSDGDNQSTDDQSNDGSEEPADDGELTNVLLIDGTASDDLAQYKVVVSGSIERSDSLSSVTDGGSPWDELEDRVDGSTATGVVAKGLDGYRFSGDLVSFQVKGHVDLTVEQAET